MICNRFESDGMKFLDGEMTAEERSDYEAHMQSCDECARELRDMGRIVEFTNELRLRSPDETFWTSYWDNIYRRMERGTGFLLLIIGLTAVTLYGIYRAATSPEFLTFKGISIALVLLGLVIVFLSVLREGLHEHKSDPYKGVKQ